MQISLTDCLACSGCVTSAETVLINQQSHEEFINFLNSTKRNDTKVVVSLSHQAISSLAIKYDCSFQLTAQKLAGFFKNILGVDYVFDITFARHLSLLESTREFTDTWKNSDRKWPILNSVCPGWVCYIEKTHGQLVEYLSRVKSPQQIMGSLIKQHWQVKNGFPNVYHLSLMPCFDKKLEASREYFMHKETGEKDVDCVLTPIEMEQLFQVKQTTFDSLLSSNLDQLNNEFKLDDEIASHLGSGSGGYAENVLTLASKKLFGLEKLPNLNFTIRRNKDFTEITVSNDSGGDSGLQQLKFAIVNGFRNIQTLVQMIKRNKCPYQFVEVMACPGGCLNGGAQVRPDEITHESFLEKVNVIYSSLKLTKLPLDIDDDLIVSFFSQITQEKRNNLVYTQFKEVPKTSNLLTLKW